MHFNAKISVALLAALAAGSEANGHVRRNLHHRALNQPSSSAVTVIPTPQPTAPEEPPVAETPSVPAVETPVVSQSSSPAVETSVAGETPVASAVSSSTAIPSPPAVSTSSSVAIPSPSTSAGSSSIVVPYPSSSKVPTGADGQGSSTITSAPIPLSTGSTGSDTSDIFSGTEDVTVTYTLGTGVSKSVVTTTIHKTATNTNTVYAVS